jgi:hypothetical protein
MANWTAGASSGVGREGLSVNYGRHAGVGLTASQATCLLLCCLSHPLRYSCTNWANDPLAQ